MLKEKIYNHLLNSPNNITSSALFKLGLTIEDSIFIIFDYKFKENDNNNYKGKYLFNLGDSILILNDISKLSGVLLPTQFNKNNNFLNTVIINSGNLSWGGPELKNDHIFYISIFENQNNIYDYSFYLESGFNLKKVIDDTYGWNFIRYEKDINMSNISLLLRKYISLDDNLLFNDINSFLSIELISEISLLYDIDIKNYFK